MCKLLLQLSIRSLKCFILYVKKDLLLQNNHNNIKEENTDENEQNNIIENNITEIYDIINTNIEENDTEDYDTQQDDNINSQENIDFISELLIMNNKI